MFTLFKISQCFQGLIIICIVLIAFPNVTFAQDSSEQHNSRTNEEINSGNVKPTLVWKPKAISVSVDPLKLIAPLRRYELSAQFIQNKYLSFQLAVGYVYDWSGDPRTISPEEHNVNGFIGEGMVKFNFARREGNYTDGFLLKSHKPLDIFYFGSGLGIRSFNVPINRRTFENDFGNDFTTIRFNQEVEEVNIQQVYLPLTLGVEKYAGRFKFDFSVGINLILNETETIKGEALKELTPIPQNSFFRRLVREESTLKNLQREYFSFDVRLGFLLNKKD